MSAKLTEIIMTFIADALPEAIDDLDLEGIIRHLEADSSNLPYMLRSVLKTFERPHVSALTVTVVKEFSLRGKDYDVVRVGWKGKTSPTINSCVEAADTTGRQVVNRYDDWFEICEHRRELPADLRGNELITAVQAPGNPNYLRAVYDRSRDGQSNVYKYNKINEGVELILRRRT